MAATQFKVQGSDRPQQGQPLSPREEAIRRLKQKGFLDAEGKPMPRREFFMRLALGWLTFAAAVGGGLTALFAFMVPRVDFTKIEVFKVGPPSNFPPNTVDDSFKAAHRIWVVNDSQRIFAIWAVCTHLGCTPNWMPEASIFKCPCHGSGYTIEGINFEGPAPFPMRRCEVSLADDGQIVVNMGRIFYWEKGEFDDPRSFIAV
ncbi:MAG TPA: ubiquinol-cytochrome c reductase iron-sulfur subunit [Verrucomicrobiae bacterium]|nr:ubiquinol-cytochrome c reductase iron-sulfur subunit [Verrucomicrobiae bacterium]